MILSDVFRFFIILTITLGIVALINIAMCKIKIRGESIFNILAKTQKRKTLIYGFLCILILGQTILRRNSIVYWLDLLFVFIFVTSFYVFQFLLGSKFFGKITSKISSYFRKRKYE